MTPTDEASAVLSGERLWQWSHIREDGSKIHFASAVIEDCPHWCEVHTRACSVSPCPLCAGVVSTLDDLDAHDTSDMPPPQPRQQELFQWQP